MASYVQVKRVQHGVVTLRMHKAQRARPRRKSCRYCKHPRFAHNRHDPSQPPPSHRCSRCDCPCYINADGRPDWLVNAENNERVKQILADRAKARAAKALQSTALDKSAG